MKNLRFPMPRCNIAAALLGAIIALGCWAPVSAGKAASPALGEQVFRVGYHRITEIYLAPVNLGEIGTDGLNALRRIEPAWSVGRADRRITLSVGDQLAGEFTEPASDDAQGWASLTVRAIEMGRRLSESLRKAELDDIYEAVFRGILADLDNYSRYSRPSRADRERAQREGFGGVGLIIDSIDGRLIVRSVEPKTPADRAGIIAGDVVAAVDGASAADISLTELADRLRGPIGSIVRVSMDMPRPRTLVMRRDRVIPNTVKLTLDDSVALLKITRFNAATTSNLRDAIRAAERRLGEQPHGYVLDLRGNPGGLLDQAVAVADLFIRSGRIISTAGRHPDSYQRFDATADDLVDGAPVAVLVDGRTASASEIVAAALQDAKRAVVIGASSYGKGSVQTVTRLPNDGELFLTWSRLYAPSGYTLHRQGVLPSICTSKEATDAAAILQDFRQNHGMLPMSTLTTWRGAAGDDDEALARLRATCPWKAHEPELDIEVAEGVLADRSLYLSALDMTVVAER